MKIVSFKICPFVQRVTALLDAKNIGYEIEYISLSNKLQWFLDVSPHGQVPLLITDNGDALFESDAIVEYIEEVTSPLESQITPEQRALDRAWSYMATKHYLSQCSNMRSHDASTYQARAEKLNSIYHKANDKVAGRFFKGDQLSNVDIAWLPLLHRADIVAKHSHIDPLADFPNVKAWQQHLLNTGLFTQSVADDFEDSFIAFYLNDETYLGKDITSFKKCDSTCSSSATTRERAACC